MASVWILFKLGLLMKVANNETHVQQIHPNSLHPISSNHHATTETAKG